MNKFKVGRIHLPLKFDWILISLDNTRTICQKYVSISVDIFNRFASLFVDPLDCSIGENTFFFAVSINWLDCAIGEFDLFHPIWHVLFKLVVGEFEDLHLIWEGRLDGLCLWEVVDDFLVWESLLNISIIEVHNCVAIAEGLPSDLVCKNYLFLAIYV